MTISYNWLSEYLPVQVAPDRLEVILTSIGLEVEARTDYEAVRGGLRGLLIGEVLEAVPHPNADKLRLTRVNVGGETPLSIVCGAPNVAAGQKVVVAPVGATIYPTGGEPVTMKLAKIRGAESQGMICAEDEIGMGTSHAGILVLPESAQPGVGADAYFRPYRDILFEIGLTPNRADAMSHWGVARDVCAYLSHHDGTPLRPVLPDTQLPEGDGSLKIEVTVEDAAACPRYAGLALAGLRVGPSPDWLRDRLLAIGVRSINNVVDVTNYVLHETGQPLHAFDLDRIRGGRVVVRQEGEGTPFKALDGTERKLSSEDLMICDAEGGMCIAGVFGGAESGVTDATVNIFLESAVFHPTSIRKTSFRHNLRTDAATRFEKGVDPSAAVRVLQRAAALLTEVAGGRPASALIDIYPQPEAAREVTLTGAYLKKLSGKDYAPASVRGILEALGFGVGQGAEGAVTVSVPPHKRDVFHPADLVEEVLRIDGLDNIAIPERITLAPAVEELGAEEGLREKFSALLTGLGYTEILTNSITSSALYPDEGGAGAVRLLNSLSSELDLLRPDMLRTALSVVAFNSNRRQGDLRLFEFGKTYRKEGDGKYSEATHLCLYATGTAAPKGWKGAASAADLFGLKGVAEALLLQCGLSVARWEAAEAPGLQSALRLLSGTKVLGVAGTVAPALANRFDLRAPVYTLDMDWGAVLKGAKRTRVQYTPLPRFPEVERDLALVVSGEVPYAQIEEGIRSLKLPKLQSVRLFDEFRSEKLGAGKKSLAVSLTFQDREKTLTDKEIDGWMKRIMGALESGVGAEIRK